MKIHIYAPDIFPNDAVGNHCMGVAKLFKRQGFSAYLYAKNFPLGYLQIQATENLFSRFSPEDLLFVSFSIFDPFLDQLLDLSGIKLCYYHGITDPNLLKEYEPETALLCQKGLDQLYRLNDFDKILSNSLFVAHGLTPFTKKIPHIIPPIFSDFPLFQQPIAPKHPGKEEKTILVVGRVVPHKKVEDAITLLGKIRNQGFAYKMKIVGPMPNSNYSQLLFDHCSDLGLSRSVTFEGYVDEINLFNLYKNSHAYLSMSHHEGFCVPALEAMHFGLPVFVREGTAAQETVGGGGIVLRKNSIDDQIQTIIDVLESPTNNALQIEKGFRREHELLSSTRDEVWLNLLKDSLII